MCMKNLHPPMQILSTEPVLDSNEVGGRYKNLCRKQPVVYKNNTLLLTENTNQVFGSAEKKEKQTKITQVTKGK